MPQLDHFIRWNDFNIVGFGWVHFREEFLGRGQGLLVFGGFLLGALDDGLNELFGLGEMVIFQWNGQVDRVALVG